MSTTTECTHVCAHSQLHIHVHRYAIQACTHTNTCKCTYSAQPQACRLTDICLHAHIKVGTPTHKYMPSHPQVCRHKWTQGHTQNCVDIQKHVPNAKAHVQAHIHTGLWQTPINIQLDLRVRRQPARPTHTLGFHVSFSSAIALRPQSDRQLFWACKPS